ncbi:MAG: sulfite dehydrogenase [Granulosicoccus sp.]|nr:sulfite dehydrogenase [Granulosicoccus sp.]
MKNNSRAPIRRLLPLRSPSGSDRLTSSGFLKRREFVRTAGALAVGLSYAGSAKSDTPASWTKAGSEFSNYGQPNAQNNRVIRWISANPAVPGEGVSWTPLHELEGTITPNGLHFERHHNGVPEIDANQWKLVIHGKVKNALSFTLDTLHRYPMQSRICFIECGGNSNALWNPSPVQAAAGHLHGLVSCTEWTGVRLAHLLDEAGIDSQANWLVADGLDASGVSVSVPISKCLDDVLIALYQNGEPLRSENGFPARLVVPGWEGIVNLKWLRSLQLSDKPLWSKFETVSYTDLLSSGKAERMSFTMGVKSLITSPSAGQQLQDPGFYEISGLAWSGAGHIERVEVSADAGESWHEAELQDPVLDKALTRFRAAWAWDGQARVLMSRAYDSKGRVQPMRKELIDNKGHNVFYHYNAVLAWHIDTRGAITHVYG